MRQGSLEILILEQAVAGAHKEGIIVGILLKSTGVVLRSLFSFVKETAAEGQLFDEPRAVGMKQLRFFVPFDGFREIPLCMIGISNLLPQQ